jgi:hypothetical protein
MKMVEECSWATLITHLPDYMMSWPRRIRFFTPVKTWSVISSQSEFPSPNSHENTHSLHAHLKFQKRSQDLLKNWSNIFEWQWAELVLFEKVIQILFQHLEHQTRVVLMLEALICSDKIELIGIFLAKTWQDANLKPNQSQLYIKLTKFIVIHWRNYEGYLVTTK